MAIATAPTATLNLNGDGNLSEYIRLPPCRCSVGIKLVGATVATAEGTIKFCSCVSSSDASPDAMDAPQVPVAAAAVDDYAEILDVAGDYLVATWDQTTGQDVDVTMTFTIKE